MLVSATINQTQPVSTYRPFRHKRADGWQKPIGSCCQWLKSAYDYIYSEKVQKVSNSILGRTVVFTAAELAGAFIGGAIGNSVLANISSKVGILTVSCLVSGGIVAGTASVYALCAHTSQSKKTVLTSLTLSVLAVSAFISFPVLSQLGADIFYVVGGRIGAISGAIFGGYAFLKFAGSPVILWEKENYRACYLVGMTRYAAIGELFNLIVMVVRPLSQAVAYNSHIIFPLVGRMFKKKEFSGLAIAPALDKLIMDNCCGNHTIIFAREISKLMITTSSFSSIVDSLRLCITVGAGKGIDSLLNQSMLFSTLICRSFYQYVDLVKKNQDIAKAYKTYQAAFFERARDCNEDVEVLLQSLDAEKKSLNEAIRKVITDGSSFLEKKACSFLENALGGVVKLIDDLIAKIPAFEEQLIGTTRLGKVQALYLKEVLKIYTMNYLLFSLMNYAKHRKDFDRGIDIKENCQIILDLNEIISSFYLDAVMPHFFSNKLFQASNFLISGAYSIFHAPEEESYSSSSLRAEVGLVNNYYQAPSAQHEMHVEFIKVFDLSEKEIDSLVLISSGSQSDLDDLTPSPKSASSSDSNKSSKAAYVDQKDDPVIQENYLDALQSPSATGVRSFYEG